MQHATYYKTDWGLAQIRPSIQKSFESMSDRELVEMAFATVTADPEYMAEVKHRGLGNDNSTLEQLLRKVDAIESRSHAKTTEMRFEENNQRFALAF